MIRLFLKAILRGGSAADLFAMPVDVKGHTTKDGTYVAPHSAIRHKHVVVATKPGAAAQGDLLTTRIPTPAAKPYSGPVTGGSLFDYQPAPKVDQAAMDAAAVARWRAAADAEMRRLSVDEMDIAAGIEEPIGTEDERVALLQALSVGARCETVEQMNASVAAVKAARDALKNSEKQPKSEPVAAARVDSTPAARKEDEPAPAAAAPAPEGLWGVPAGTTEAVRRKLNAAAVALLADKRDDEMTPADKDVLAQYSGTGGCGDSLNEFYTEPDVAGAMWAMLRNAGFAGGDVLEPSCGTGVFLRTAPADAHVTGVELDTISARIAGILHPGHDVRLSGLERFATQDGALFDAVIGNAPFGGRGDSAKGDPGKRKISMHEQYFLDTGLDKLKDGGLMAMLVNTSVMNSKNGRAFRERLLRKAEFLGAHRLPNTAFAAANTDVTTDILLFRKRPADVAGALGTLTQAQVRATGAWDADYLAGYFEKRGRENVHGTVGTAMRSFGPIYTVDGAMDGVAAHLAGWEPDPPHPQPDMMRVLAELDGDDAAKKRALDAAQKRPYQTAKVGDVQVIDGVRYILQGDPPRWHRLDAEVPEAVTAALKVSEGLDDLLEGRAKDPRLTRAMVAEELDAYISQHGLPQLNKDLLAWISAPSLERTEGGTAEDHQGRVQQARRRVAKLLGAVDRKGAFSDAITGRAADQGQPGIDSAAERLSVERGGFTVEALAGRTGQSPETVLDHLHASPGYAVEADGKTWTTMDTYLSGELWPKLDAAKAAAEHEGLSAEYRLKYQAQARALEETIAPASLEDVEIVLSSGFITPAAMNAYFEARAEEQRARYTGDSAYAPQALRISYADGAYTVTQGYQASLIDKYLNRTGVRKDDRDELDRLNADFAEWVRTGAMREEIEDRYNRLYKGFRQREYSDAPMVIPGLTQAIDVNGYHFSGLRWALDQGKGIIADDVGLGKTGRGLMLAKLAKAHGTAKKPTFVVPKSVLANWVEETQTWFPGSRVLVIGESYEQNADGSFKRDGSGKLIGKPDNEAARREKYHALKQNDYDFVLVSKPSWDKLDLSPDLKERYQGDEFWEKRKEALGNSNSKGAAKKHQKARDAHDLKMGKREFQDREGTIYFDDLGIDMILMDEGHCFPAGTLVDGRPIESYRAGDSVSAFDHATGQVVFARVANLQVHKAPNLFRVTLSDGTAIACTGSHPFFTSRGYVAAEKLIAGDIAYKNLHNGSHAKESLANGRAAFGDGGMALRQLQGQNEAYEGAGLASSGAEQEAFLLQQAVRYALETGATEHPGENRGWPDQGSDRFFSAGCTGSPEERERHGASGSSGEGERYPQAVGLSAEKTWGQRLRFDETAVGIAGGAWPRLDAGVHRPGAVAAAGELAMVLRDRLGIALSPAGRGSGWQFPLDSEGEASGPEERGALGAVRVDRVEVLESGSDGRYGGVCPGGFVFNIEVDVHHNYFAEGVLVHNSYKNLFSAKNRFGMSPKFLGGSGESNTAMDTYFKSKFVRAQNAGKGVFLLTATPTKNSPLEIYSMLSHIAPEAFEAMGIKNSEDFIDRFVEFTSDNIIQVSGELEEALITSGFKNLGELREVMRRYINRRTAEDVGLVIPEPDNIEHLLDMSPEQEAVYVGLRKEAENARNSKEDSTGESHIFSIMDRMQKASTDLALLGHTGSVSPKVERMADTAVKHSAEGGQIIFCEPVDEHATIVDALVKRGVPREQIAIINAREAPNGSDRQKICDAFNSGKVKFVVGNKTMEQGVNLQKMTSDIHHLDLPWEPATLQQRNGRGRRQGNKRARIRLHTYLAKKSFDVYRHQTIGAKRNWMDLLWNGGDRVENLGREGGFSLADVSIMLSDDPEAALAKREADTAAAVLRKQVSDRARAVQSWKRLRTMEANLAKMTADKRDETKAAYRLRAESVRARELLHKNRAFPHKDLIDSGEAAIVDPVTGVAWRAGMGMEVAPGPASALKVDGDRPERFVVEMADVPNNRVWLRSVGGRRTNPVSLTAEQLQNGVTPWTHTEAAEAEEAAHFLDTKSDDMVALALGHHDFSKVHALPAAVAAKHAPEIQAQLKHRLANAKISAGYGSVPMVHLSTGKPVMAPTYHVREMLKDHDFMLPTPEHREAAIGAWVDERMKRAVTTKYRDETPKRGRRYGYGQPEAIGVKAQYQGVGQGEKHANPFVPALNMHGKEAVMEANLRVRGHVAASIAAAPTMHAAFEAAQPAIRIGDLGNGGGWPEATVRALWDKAAAAGALGRRLGDEATKVEPARNSWSQAEVKAAGHKHFYQFGQENWLDGYKRPDVHGESADPTVGTFLWRVAKGDLKAELEAKLKGGGA